LIDEVTTEVPEKTTPLAPRSVLTPRIWTNSFTVALKPGFKAAHGSEEIVLDYALHCKEIAVPPAILKTREEQASPLGQIKYLPSFFGRYSQRLVIYHGNSVAKGCRGQRGVVLIGRPHDDNIVSVRLSP
jgi:hypothetical protein